VVQFSVGEVGKSPTLGVAKGMKGHAHSNETENHKAQKGIKEFLLTIFSCSRLANSNMLPLF